MSTFGTFQEWGQTRNGGPKLKIDGKWVFPQRSTNTDGLQPGMKVEYETHLGGDKGTLVLLDRIRPAPQAPSNGAGPVFPIPPAYDEAELRFISNVVGSALTAGKLSAPHEVTVWALAAQRALGALKADDKELNDRIPGEDDEQSENPAPPNQPQNGAARRDW